MNAVPADLISFARIPKRDRWGDRPQYRIYVRGVPGGLGAGYTDIVVRKVPQGWYLACHKTREDLVRDWDDDGYTSHTRFHKTRQAAAAEMHLDIAPSRIPQNVHDYLVEVTR